MTRTDELICASVEAMCRCTVYYYVEGMGYVRPDNGWSFYA